tara:strand:+ start:1228 stop:1377 length:150 start_codon:yes stop_codon:yes gene_type:complete
MIGFLEKYKLINRPAPVVYTEKVTPLPQLKKNPAYKSINASALRFDERC